MTSHTSSRSTIQAAAATLSNQKQTSVAKQADSETWYRMLFDTMEEAFAVLEMIHGPDGRVDFLVVAANSAFERQSGLQDVLGKTVRQLVPDLHPRWIERYAQILKGRAKLRFQDHVDELNRWFDVLAWPFVTTGDPRLAVLFTDITDRKRTEEALRESEERFRTMAGECPLLIWVHDAQGRLEFADRTSLEFFGATEKELKESGWQMLLHPDDREAYAGEFRACLHVRRSFHAITRIRRGDGQWRWLESWGNPRWSDTGVFLGYVIAGADITERKMVEEELRESRERLIRSQQVAHLGSWEFDVVEDKLIWSDEVYRIFGLQPQNIAASYQAFLQCVHPDDRETVNAAFMNSMKGKEDFYEIEHRVVQPGGETRIVHERCEHLRDAAGRVIRSMGMVHDITERVQAEQLLHEKQAWLSSIFRAAPIGIGAVIDRAFVDVNDKFCEMVGYAKEDLIGQSARIVYPTEEEYNDLGQEKYRQIEQRGMGTVETRFRCRDGSIIDILMSSTPLDPDDLSKGVVFTALDITGRKRTENALKERERHYRSLFQSMEAFALLEPVLDQKGLPYDFRYLEVNDAGARVRGLEPEKIQGRTILEVLPNIDRFWITAYTQVLLSGKPLKFEHLSRLNQRWYRTYAYCPEKGKVASLIIDISDKKQAERSLQELTRTLEQKVAERTELAEARAKQLQALSVELIEAEERAKQRLSELLHEDLQQILASARMQLQAACARSPSDPLLGTVNELLEESFAKCRSLAYDLSPAVLHHCDLVAALQWLARSKKERFGLQVELKAPAEPIHLEIPIKIFLFRAVKELLFNIVKHAGVKRARVVLSRSENAIFLTVSDKGQGFNIDILNSANIVGGVGLLSLRERASYIGGSLIIESTPRRGSRFTLTVPLKLLKTEQPEQLPGKKVAGGTCLPAPASGAVGIRVLFADDHKVMRQGLIGLVSGQSDVSVVGEAANGREALELAMQLHPDVVVMDVSMPVMDGLEATRRIKAALPHVRVIGLSMHDDQNVARAMLTAGAERFLTKTASSAELLKAIYGL